MPPAGRNSPLHKFSDLCKGRISLSVAEGSKLPDGKMFSHPTNWCCFSVVRVRSICNPYIVYSHRLLQICFSIVKTTDHLPPGKEFYFFIQAFTSVLLTIEFFFQSFFPVAGGRCRWLVVGGRCRCRPLSVVPFLSQPSVFYSPFSVKLCPLPLPIRFSQTHPSISVQTLQPNVSFGLSPIACLIKRQLLPLRDFHEAVPCCILLRIRLPVPGFLFAVQFEFSGSTVGIFEEAENISNLF